MPRANAAPRAASIKYGEVVLASDSRRRTLGSCDPFAPWLKPVRVAGLEDDTTSSFVLSPDETRALLRADDG